MDISLSNLIFGVLPFFVIIFEAWVVRSGFENIDGERFPRIIYLFAFVIGIIPIINFIMMIVVALFIIQFIIHMVLDQDSNYRFRSEKGLLHWLFKRD